MRDNMSFNTDTGLALLWLALRPHGNSRRQQRHPIRWTSPVPWPIDSDPSDKPNARCAHGSLHNLSHILRNCSPAFLNPPTFSGAMACQPPPAARSATAYWNV